jgi:hypothetical protein
LLIIRLFCKFISLIFSIDILFFIDKIFFSAFISCFLRYIFPEILELTQKINSRDNSAQSTISSSNNPAQPTISSSNNPAQTKNHSSKKFKTLIDILQILAYLGIIGFELLNYYKMFGVDQSQLEKLAQSFNTDISFEQIYENVIEGNYLFKFLLQIKQLYALVFVVILFLLFGIPLKRTFSLLSDKITSLFLNSIRTFSNISDLEVQSYLNLAFDLIFNCVIMHISLYFLLDYTGHSIIQIIDYCEKYTV